MSTYLNMFMHINPKIKPVAVVDKTTTAYTNFFNALQSVNWAPSDYIIPATEVLSYAPGFVFNNIEWSNSHPGFKRYWGEQHFTSSPELDKAKEYSLEFFRYLEELIPGHRVVRAEMMATLPESVDRRAEVNRMHYDARVLHVHCRRCQLGFYTNEQSLLFVEGESMQINTDTVYEFDNRLCHWGVNWGNTLKLVLVFDLINLSHWNTLNSRVKENFFEPEKFSFDEFRYKQFVAKFKKEHSIG